MSRKSIPNPERRNKTERKRGVAYWRMSSSMQEESIAQQQAAMRPRAQLEGVDLVREFDDAAQSGGDSSRDGYADMLAFCQQEAARGEPIDVIVVYKTSRLSRADSQETNYYVWQF